MTENLTEEQLKQKWVHYRVLWKTAGIEYDQILEWDKVILALRKKHNYIATPEFIAPKYTMN